MRGTDEELSGNRKRLSGTGRKQAPTGRYVDGNANRFLGYFALSSSFGTPEGGYFHAPLRCHTSSTARAAGPLVQPGGPMM